MEFEESFKRLIDIEKGFTGDPRDSGNWTGGKVGSGHLRGTKYGISAASYPTLDIASLTVEQAINIYRRDFWDKLRLDELQPGVRFDLFDMAVNSGLTGAAKILQRAVGVVDDGVIGPKTIAAARALTSDKLDKRLNGYRLRHLCGCSAWPAYGRGWVERVAKNLIED